MPYAIYSKRTGIVSRVVNDLSSMLPSENMIEVDEELAYPRNFKHTVLGQKVNTLGIKVFDMDTGAAEVPITVPADPDDSGDRPAIQTYAPLFVKYDTVDAYIDLPLYANPFGWTADELAAAKYESLLAKNFPYQVVVGEEFIDDSDINSGGSSDYYLSEGKLILNPGGVLWTRWFYLRLNKKPTNPVALGAVLASWQYWSLYAWDTYFFTTTPVLFPGVTVELDYKGWDIGDDDTVGVIADDEVDVGTLVRGFRLKFTNNTKELFPLENYMMFLRFKRERNHSTATYE